jgi:phosphate transport system substrate-binding protein
MDSDIGFGTTVPWPVGLAGQGNGGVAAIVKQTPYSIGYVELTDAARPNCN